MLRAHNALLHVYASHGQVQKAKQLYTAMQERGPAIDVVSASTLIAAFAKVQLLVAMYALIGICLLIMFKLLGHGFALRHSCDWQAYPYVRSTPSSYV